jgi:DNA repair exonuclease SbcCD ATPase subunit
MQSYVWDIQGELQELAKELRHADCAEDAEEVEQAREDLDELESLLPEELPGDGTVDKATKRKVRTSGLLNRLKRILDDLEDEDSTLYRNVRRIKSAMKTVRSIAQGYNKLAPLLDLPPVPLAEVL